MGAGRHAFGADLTRAQVFGFVVTAALNAGAFALTHAPVWVVVSLAGLFAAGLGCTYLRDRRRG